MPDGEGIHVVSMSVRRILAQSVCVTTAAVMVLGGLIWMTPALSASASVAQPAASSLLPSQCAQSGTTETCTFTTTGETQFTVPENVSSIRATVVGGHGGTSLSGTQGGLGAVGAGTIAVTDGETLFLEVNVLGGTAGRDNGIVDGGAAAASPIFAPAALPLPAPPAPP